MAIAAALAGLAALQAPTLAVRVQHADGSGAVGARVVVMEQPLHAWSNRSLLGDGVADANGRAEVPIPDSWHQRIDWKDLDVWVQADDRAIAYRHVSPEDVVRIPEHSIVLEPSTPWPARVLGPDGIPVQDALVSVVSVPRESFGTPELPSSVRDSTLATSASDGAVRLSGLGERGPHTVRVEHPDWGVQDLVGTLEMHERGGLVLDRALSVLVDVTGVAPSLVEPAQFSVMAFSRRDPAPGSGWIAGQNASVRGRLVIDPGLLGSRELGPLIHGGFNPRFLGIGPSAILPAVSATYPEGDQPWSIGIAWQEGLPASGSVVDAATGAGVPGARVTIFRSPIEPLELATGPDGRFEFRCVPGTESAGGSVAITSVIPPPPYLPWLEHFEPLRVEIPASGSFELPPVKLVRGITARGRVVDGDGNPVAGALIHADYDLKTDENSTRPQLTCVSGSDGSFELGAIQTGAMLELVARKGSLVAEQAMQAVRSDQLAELEVVLGSRGAPVAMLSAVVRDPDARPVAGALMSLWAGAVGEDGFDREPIEHAGTSPASRSDGVLEITRPSAGRLHALVVSRAGFETQRTPWSTPDELAEWCEQGFVLVPLAELRGRIVGEDGTPVSGARITTTAIGAGAQATSDADGRFELAGLPPEPVELLAMLPDGRASRTLADVGDLDQPLVLTISDGRRPIGPGAAQERQPVMARRILQPVFDRVIAVKDEVERSRAANAMAALDPGWVFESLGPGLGIGGRPAFSLHDAMRALAAVDPREAMALAVLQDRPSSIASLLCSIAGALPIERAEERRAILADAAVRARGLEDPLHRLAALADVARILVQQGDLEPARELVLALVPLAESTPGVDWGGYARGCLAEVLMVFDRAAAEELIAGIAVPDDQARHLGNAAQLLAPYDPSTAVALLHRAAGQFDVRNLRSKVAFAMAPVDPRRAVEACGPDGLGAVGLALVDLDPALAIEALENAFATIEGLPRDGKQGIDVFRGPSSAAGMLLELAARAAPERLDEYVMRALALRPSRGGSDLAREERARLADLALAYFVAPHDQDAARSLVEPVLAEIDARVLVPREVHEWGVLPAALAALDPPLAVELAQRWPDGLAIKLVHVLAREGEARRNWVLKEVFLTWYPGAYDYE